LVHIIRMFHKARSTKH